MLNSILIITGIALMILSVFRCIKLIKVNVVKNLQGTLYLMLCLIIFFLLGYTSYLFLDTNYPDIPVSSLLICLILFFGAIFVVGILSISYQLIKILTQRTEELNQINKTLTGNTNTLKTRQEELVKTREMLEQRNSELEETLDDFYTMRISVQKEIESNKIEEENKKIKERLDNLKINQKEKSS
jgi:hypothetical protein